MIAQGLEPVPDPDIVVTEITTVSTKHRNLSQSYEALATQVGRINNIPALDAGQKILEELRRGFDRMEMRFISM